MISIRLKNLLEQNGIAFEVVPHDPAFTAQQLAARMHVPGKEFVKAVVVKLDGRYAIAALSANRLVDTNALARVAGAARCELAGEAEFRDLFPECEVGAMPPVGRLYDLPTYVDEEVTRDESIVANAGTHAEAVRLRYADLARVARPTVGRFGVPSPTEQPRQRGATARRPSRPKAAPRKAVGRKKAPSKKGKKAARRKKTVRKTARTKAARPKKAGRKTARKKAPRRKRTAGRKSSARRRTARARKSTRVRKVSAKKAVRKRTAAPKKRHR